MTVNACYIDNEPASGEWTSIVEAGSSTCVRATNASFPDRGSYGLRVTISGSSAAYARRDTIATLDWEEELYVGCWIRVVTLHASGGAILNSCLQGGTNFLRLKLYDDGVLRLVYVHDGGAVEIAAADTTLRVGSWYWIVFAVKKRSASSADGWARLYQGGQVIAEATSLDNDTTLTGDVDLYCGVKNAQDGLVVDCDEAKVSASYPEPYVPTPANEYLSGRRTVVLYRDSDEDSRLIADLLGADYQIPQSNLVPLPNASTDETLADYATWQTEVENDLDAVFSRHPTVLANCMCFVLGLRVPGYFYLGGDLPYSATSRLMNYGTAFHKTKWSYADNPLYAPAAVARLTKTALGGKYLCTRIDADCYSWADDLRMRSATISAFSELPDSDVLYARTTAYRNSLACQRLRILTGAPGNGKTLDDAAFCNYNWGVSYEPSDYGDGTRAAFIDSSDGAQTLREAVPTSALAKALFTYGWAAGHGYTDAVAAYEFDAASFYEMLRIGGTLAEALAVAIPRLDYLSVAIGAPLMTVAFQDDGYNVYRAVSGMSNLGATPVAYLRSDDTNPTLTGVGHEALTRYTYLIRPVYNDLETPDFSCAADMETAGDGSWIGTRPAMVERLDAEVVASGKIRLRWRYETPRGGQTVADFGVYYQTGPDIFPGSPQTTDTYTVDGEYEKDVTLVDGVTYWFAITARAAGSVESHLSPIIGPFVADGTAPAAPAVYASSAF